jgi:hypothetical protein
MVAYPPVPKGIRWWTEPGLQALWQSFRFSSAGQAALTDRHRRVAAPLAPAYMVEMARTSRSSDWGFPRWRGYEADREAVKVRLCDRDGCDQPGDRPAPKSPNSPERWYFCQEHAGEYNRNWNYFEGLTAEEAARREAEERRVASGFTESRHNSWAGPGDGSRSRDEMRALEVLELEADASFEDVRTAWRRLAKSNHPDVKPGDADAATRFQAIQAAYDVLRTAEERRQWRPPERE